MYMYSAGRHPELKPFLNDLRFLKRIAKLAVELDLPSEELVKALEGLYRCVARAFWGELYEVSPLHGGMRLTLEITEDGDGLVFVEDDDRGDN